ncbi:MAG: hypothetical protein NZ480_01095 [Bdellovibrionaceae bacterium]|nr:hypothetical protein [Pseudobdellovibrionaceae bacterium]MDW8190787.1 hypothetical protein [Pseudobdellovibrionaceae bacterium]
MLLILAFMFLSWGPISHAQVLCEVEQFRQREISAIQLIERWIDTLQSYVPKRTPDSTFREEVIIKTNEELAIELLQCVQRKLKKGFRYWCEDESQSDQIPSSIMFLKQFVSPNHLALTLPWGRDHYFLKHFFTLPWQHQLAIVIHEATHKCGTFDYLYWRYNQPVSSQGWVSWVYIAQTYESWALTGFCHPDYATCQFNFNE